MASLAQIQEIANRGLQDRLPPDRRAKFDELVRRGAIKLQSAPIPKPVKDAEPPAEPSLIDKNIGVLETAGTVASGIVAEPLAGLAGIAQTLNPFAEQGAGDRAVTATREALTYKPRTQSGNEMLEDAGKVLQPVAEAFSGAEDYMGDEVFKHTNSPALSAAAKSLPTLALEILGVAGVKGTKNVVKNAKNVAGKAEVNKAILEAAPTIDQLKTVSRAAFKEIDDMGAVIDGNSYGTLARDIAKRAHEMGADKDVTPLANKALQRFTNELYDAQGNPKNIATSDLDVLREVAKGAAGSNNKKESAIGSMMVDAVDDFVSDLPDTAIKSTKGANVQDIAARYKIGRDLWGRARRSELVQEAFDNARNQASGFENGIRTQFRSILNNKKQKKFFNKDELDAIRKVVRGGNTENLLKFMGRFGLFEGGSTSALMSLLGTFGGAAVGAAVGAPGLGAVAVPIIGQISRGLAQKMTRGGAEFADSVIRAGKDANKITNAYFKHTKKADRSAEELSELLIKKDIPLTNLPDNVIVLDAVKLARQRRAELAAGALAGSSGSASADE